MPQVMVMQEKLDIIRVHDFVGNLGVNLPPVENFWSLGDVTALRDRVDGSFFRSNYERGILLYALVAKHRPMSVLEFGTGRGYGCLCMAWAMRDCGISGMIHTIDMVSSVESIRWPICWNESEGPQVEDLSRSEVWSRAAHPAWLEHVKEWTGYSAAAMREFSGDPVDFAFIDAGHGHRGVRHDFYAALGAAGKRIDILFDDYSFEDVGYGTRKLIQEEVLEHQDASLILTDRRWPEGEKEHYSDASSGMVWINCENPQYLLDEIQPKFWLGMFNLGYRFWEMQYRLRRILVLMQEKLVHKVRLVLHVEHGERIRTAAVRRVLQALRVGHGGSRG